MPTLFGTCPKCKTDFELTGEASSAGILCPECKKKGDIILGVIHFKPKKPTLTKAAKALIRYFEDNKTKTENPKMLIKRLRNLEKALDNHIMEKMEAKAIHPGHRYLDESTEE